MTPFPEEKKSARPPVLVNFGHSLKSDEARFFLKYPVFPKLAHLGHFVPKNGLLDSFLIPCITLGHYKGYKVTELGFFSGKIWFSGFRPR